MNNVLRNILLPALLVFSAVSCRTDEAVEFGVDVSEFAFGPEGGTRTFRVNYDGDWYARTNVPWITVSPANGKGTVECRIIVDSTLLVNEPRTEILQIVEVVNANNYKEIKVEQEGFEYAITPEKDEISVADYADMNARSFDIVVNTNVDFKVEIPDNAGWLTSTRSALNLDKGMRPRNVTVHFEWRINTQPSERIASVILKPVEDVGCEAAGLKVIQEAADEIEIGVAGDSLALLAINRNLGCWVEYDTSERMKHWADVDVWDEYDENYADANAAHFEQYGTKIDGRVRYARFYIFETREGIPYEVQYLTAAEELIFYGNSNTFLYSLDPGEYITKLPQLKRLGICAYGLATLPEEFTRLESLEALYLDHNNFQKIPEILTPENFPHLKALSMLSNQRYLIYNLKLDYRENCGGLVEETDWTRLLKWQSLDTLQLGVNYLSGEIPSYEDDPQVERWSEADKDVVPEAMYGIPKILPDTHYFTINYNRLHGNLPDWILYHPLLDQWYPESLVFPQEGTDSDGNAAKFDNAPTSLEYYYDFYKDYKENPYETE